MRSLALLAAVTVTLSGCSSVGDAFGTPENNIGPCPTAFALHDAHRLVQFNGDDIVYDNIGFTGEITGVRSLCSYYDERPILANLEIDLARKHSTYGIPKARDAAPGPATTGGAS